MFRSLVLLLLVVMSGCGHTYVPPPQLPAPVPSASVGPGDVLEIVVVGEEKLPKEYEVQPDGTLDFPFIESQKVNGLVPRQIAELVGKNLVQVKYLVDPQVQVKVKQFNSKKIYLVGQVARAGPLTFTEGMTFTQAIIASGGFTPLADQNHVQVIRIVSPTKSVNAIVSFNAITDNIQPDVKLQQNDTIKVDQRLF